MRVSVMRKSTVIGILVIAVAGLAYFSIGQVTAPKADVSTPTPASNPGSQPIIRYNGTAFSPATYTLKSGTTVTFLNTSTLPLAVDSDPHPVHTDNSELNVGDIPAGSSKSVT